MTVIVQTIIKTSVIEPVAEVMTADHRDEDNVSSDSPLYEPIIDDEVLNLVVDELPRADRLCI